MSDTQARLRSLRAKRGALTRKMKRMDEVEWEGNRGSPEHVDGLKEYRRLMDLRDLTDDQIRFLEKKRCPVCESLLAPGWRIVARRIARLLKEEK